jgi:Tfp pilus assembly protein PilE
LENCRYPVGSKIVAKLKSGTIVKGEVTAFDPSYKIIMIKSPGSRHGLNNASMLNLAHCVDIKVEEEGKDAPGELHSLNTDKLAIRLRDNVERKKRLVMAFKAGISPAGQRMFQAILKTIDDVQWNGENIVVMRDVTIAPPYRPDTIRGNQESQALLYVRKIVEKHISDQEAAAKIAGAAAASTPTSSMSSSTVSVDSTTTAPTSTSSTATTTTSATASTTATATSTTTTSSTTTSKPTGGGTGSSRTNRSSAGGGRSNNRYNHEHPKPMYNQ